MPRGLVLLVGLLAACRGQGNAGRSARDTSVVFAAPPANAPVLRVSITRDGQIAADGRPVSMPMLDSVLGNLKAAQGVVWYYHEAPGRRPSIQEKAATSVVLSLILHHQLPLRLSTQPDFSDVVGRDRP